MNLGSVTAKIAAIYNAVIQIKNQVGYLVTQKQKELGLATATAVDFFVDNFDRADSNDLGRYWGNASGNFQIRGGRAMQLTSRISLRQVSSVAQGTGNVSDPSIYTDYIPHYTSNSNIHPSKSTPYKKPLSLSTKASIKIKMVVPPRGNEPIIPTEWRSWTAIGVSYNGTEDRNGIVTADVFCPSVFSTIDVSLHASAGSQTATIEYDFTISFFDATGNTLPPTHYSGVLASTTASAGAASFSMSGATYASAVHVTEFDGGSQFFTPVIGDSYYDSVSNYSSTSVDRTLIGSHGSYTVAGYRQTNDGYMYQDGWYASVVPSYLQVTTEHPSTAVGVYRPTTINMYYKGGATSAHAGASVRAAHYGLRDIPKLPSSSTEATILAEIIGDRITISVDGVQIKTGVNTSPFPEGTIGLISMVDDLLLPDPQYRGIKQVKAWIGDVEPPDETGHGTITTTNGNTTFKYTDGYHITDAQGNVTYNPTALDPVL